MAVTAEEYQGLKYQQGAFKEVSDGLTVEEAIQICINDEPYTVTMRTPGNDPELVRGLLYSEDLYRNTNGPFEIKVTQTNELGITTGVNVSIPPGQLGDGYINGRSILSVSSCGICGKRELDDLTVSGDPLSGTETIRLDALLQMFDAMNARQETFKLSGGSHAAAAFTLDGDLLAVQEDIGRHNAVDKVVGSLLYQERLSDARCLLVSGRISYEIVTKAFVAKIPFLAAVSAPSTLAVDYAKELGITLLAFCRGDKATVYANASKIDRTSDQ